MRRSGFTPQLGKHVLISYQLGSATHWDFIRWELNYFNAILWALLSFFLEIWLFGKWGFRDILWISIDFFGGRGLLVDFSGFSTEKIFWPSPENNRLPQKPAKYWLFFSIFLWCFVDPSLSFQNDAFCRSVIAWFNARMYLCFAVNDEEQRWNDANAESLAKKRTLFGIQLDKSRFNVLWRQQRQVLIWRV